MAYTIVPLGQTANDQTIENLGRVGDAVNANFVDLYQKSDNAAQSINRWQLPDYPAILPVDVAQWSATTAYAAGAIVPCGSKVFFAARGGTSGSTRPSATSGTVTDNTVIWQYLGPYATFAYANSLTVYAGMTFVANGNLYMVTADGTFASSGTGPSGLSTGTDGTASYAYQGPQTKPVVSMRWAQDGSLSKQLSIGQSSLPSQLVPLGCTPVFSGINGVTLVSASNTGAPYAYQGGGGGTLATVTDAPLVQLQYYYVSRQNVYVDGEHIAYVHAPNSVLSAHANVGWLTIDSTGLQQPVTFRSIKIEQDTNSQLITGVFATAADKFEPYVPENTLVAVHVGDSFVEGVAVQQPWCLCYSVRLGHKLGIENWRSSGVGGTGVLQPNGGSVNFRDRWARDVLPFAPDILFLQGTQNDQNNLGVTYTAAELQSAATALITSAKATNSNLRTFVLGTWSARNSPVTGNNVTVNSCMSAAASATGSAFCDWQYMATSATGGYIGNVSGTGISNISTASDGVHPSPYGHTMRACYVDRAYRGVFR